ncbi:MAG: hypothetical protein ACYSUF_09665 [Planctomycetota bacterium]|jgi:hypothetical protein
MDRALPGQHVFDDRLLHPVPDRVIVLLADDDDVGVLDGLHQRGPRHALAVLAPVDRQRRAHVFGELHFGVTTGGGAPTQGQAQEAGRGGRYAPGRGCGKTSCARSVQGGI